MNRQAAQGGQRQFPSRHVRDRYLCVRLRPHLNEQFFMQKFVQLHIIAVTHSQLRKITMLDFFKDIFAAFKQNSIERIRNPFVGAFVFSWVGFNWQTLSIMLFSNKDVIDRVEYIKSHYDVSDFILAPALTTVLICIILPLANQFFTTIQSKPIEKTTTLNMNAKINVAELQLKIADIEAQKKLAHKREERNIEENIVATKNMLERLESEARESSNSIYSLKNSLAKANEIIESKDKEISTLQEKHTELLADIKTLNANDSLKNTKILTLEKKDVLLNKHISKFQEANRSLASYYPDVFELLSDDHLQIKPNWEEWLKTKSNINTE